MYLRVHLIVKHISHEGGSMSNEQGPQEVYKPSPEVIANANVKSYDEMAAWADRDLEGFWAARPKSSSGSRNGTRCWTIRNTPFYKWFVGGKTNIVYNCLDRHVETWRRNKLALIWEGENGDVRTFSYHALNREVCKFANVLRSMGVKKGDRVTIYMGRVPELPIAMLACAKIGAVHSVVYGGFSVEALHGPHRGQPVQGRHHLRRQLHERQDRRAQEDHG